MSGLWARRAAALNVLVVFALEVAAVALTAGSAPLGLSVIYLVYSVVQAAAGALVVHRHPRHRIGWLLALYALQNAVMGDLALAYGRRAAEQGWPLAIQAELVGMVSWIFAASGLVLLFLLFPGGSLPQGRWRAVPWLWAAGAALAVPSWTVNPRLASEYADGVNPFAVDGFPADQVFALGGGLVCLALVLSIASLAVRLRHSRGQQRQQLKWVAYAAAMVGLILPASAALWTFWEPIQLLAAVALMFLPIAACIAILRHQLYDVDLVIARTAAYVVLTVVLATTYAAVVLAVGAVVASPVASAAAALVVAVAFRPVRDRAQDAVDRRFRQARHKARAIASEFVDALRRGEAPGADVETAFRRAMRDDDLEIVFDVSDADVLDAHGNAARLSQHSPDRTVSTVVTGSDVSTLIHHRVEDAPLLIDVVDAGRLAIEIAALQVQLRRQVREVDASRARIVAVGDEERRRLARDLHDGAQQRLVSIGLGLRHVQHVLEPDGPKEVIDALDLAVDELTHSIDELRELAGGLRPGSLDGGLENALRELAARTRVPLHITVADERFPGNLETAAYFIACEGVTNVVKHAGAAAARVTVSREDGALVVRICDDGRGGADPRRGSGLSGLADRVRAHHGVLSVESEPGRGTTLEARLPCG